jgi:hypothetical protein
MAFAIFFTGDLLRECAFRSRTSAFDQVRRLVRLTCLLAISHCCERRAELEKKLETRTHELDDARNQLAAISEVLQVISSSPGELAPLFQAITANASRASNRKDSTPRYGRRLLRCGISTRPITAVGHERPKDDLCVESVRLPTADIGRRDP